MEQAADCIFCRIVAGQAPAFRLVEGERALVILDAYPVAPGHALVISRRHARDLFELEEGEAEEVARLARRVALAQRQVMGLGGVNLLNSNGRVAQQTVFHFHLHVIPRTAGDGLNVWAGKRLHPVDRELGARLRAALAGEGA
ncbi:MAG: HIT domain-containing protein [Clostridia bacterium]|nr:HIT domain-containing protein [Clostridia bacterium]MCL6521595.1 HIT domain-containing protein [Bacillota bacterium]